MSTGTQENRISQLLGRQSHVLDQLDQVVNALGSRIEWVSRPEPGPGPTTDEASQPESAPMSSLAEKLLAQEARLIYSVQRLQNMLELLDI